LGALKILPQIVIISTSSTRYRLSSIILEYRGEFPQMIQVR
jgi:hypothetical protein